MLEIIGVQRAAYGLVFFLEDHKKDYAEFILAGQR